MILLPGVERVWAALPEARIAGGAVRDHLLGVPVADVDFASPLLPQAVMQRLRDAGIKSVPTGLAHGTVTAVIGKRGFEITTLRRDVETDGRHAKVAFTDDWQQDAARRDFTINAMSMTQDGTVFDYFGGQADLQAGIVRFVGTAELRIAEDYLRMLRFFRFFARYAKGEPDPAAIAAIIALRDGVKQLSAERVWSELKRILAAADPGRAIALMQRTGLLALLLSDGFDIARLNRLLACNAPPEPLLRIAALATAATETLAAELKLSVAEQEILQAYRQPGTLHPSATEAELRRALADEDGKILIARSWLAQTDEPGWDELRRRIAATKRPVFPLQGRDILQLGVPAGPRVGEILESVRAWWLQNGCVDDLGACMRKAQALLPPV
jgi:poly(A) polymerase/tRNA nucleotidyltransferase (CCA-adding enzyme)